MALSGKAPYAYLIDLRVQRAAELLRAGRSSVTEAAFAVGFSDLGRFARAFRATDKAVADIWGRPPLYLREGGSVPIIADIKRATGLDSVMFGLFLPEDNLHAPNESFNLDVMKKGIATTRRIFGELAK